MAGGRQIPIPNHRDRDLLPRLILGSLIFDQLTKIVCLAKDQSGRGPGTTAFHIDMYDGCSGARRFALLPASSKHRGFHQVLPFQRILRHWAQLSVDSTEPRVPPRWTWHGSAHDATSIALRPCPEPLMPKYGSAGRPEKLYSWHPGIH